MPTPTTNYDIVFRVLTQRKSKDITAGYVTVSMIIEIPDIKSNLGRKAVRYRGPVTWNALPCDLEDNKKFYRQICKKGDETLDNHPT